MRNEFTNSILANQASFGLALGDDAIERLATYYEFIQEHNPILHLVGPSTPGEFAVRHILESLTLLRHLPAGSKFADVGTGAGLPSIPCLLVREDLRVVLIESKEKKTKFLEAAVNALGIASRASVVNKQFQEVDPADCETVTCRALDKFTEKLPGLVKWAKRRRFAIFGGPAIESVLAGLKIGFTRELMPGSDQRYLFVRS